VFDLYLGTLKERRKHADVFDLFVLAQLPQFRDHRSDFLGLLDRISSSCCVRVSEMRV